MSTQDYRIENGLVVNGPITADNVPGALSDLTDLDMSVAPQSGDALVWDETAGKWKPGVVVNPVAFLDDIGDVYVDPDPPSGDRTYLKWNTESESWSSGDLDLSGSYLSDLTNVDATSPTDGQALVWNETDDQWKPGSVVTSIASINEIGDVDTATTPPTDGQALVWNDTTDSWKPGSVVTSIASINELGDVDTATTPPLDGQALVWNETTDSWKPGAVSGGGAGGSSHLLALDNISSQFTGLRTVFTLTQNSVNLPTYVQVSDLLLFIGGAIQSSSSFTWNSATSEITLGSPPPTGAYFVGWLTTPPYWIFQAGESPNPDLIYTQYKVGIGTYGDQSLNYDLVVGGDTLLSDVKISGTSLIGDGFSSYLGDIKLVPNESLVSQGQYVKIRPTVNLDQTHIHIEAGNVNTADLYLGDDDRYVKIDHTGPVTIGVPSDTTTSNWTADSDATGTTYISIALATYPWAEDLTIGDTVTLPNSSSVTISNAYFDIDYAYVTVDSPITYATSDILEFSYLIRHEWKFNPNTSTEFPGDLTATSFIGDGSELTGIELAGLADVDTTTLPPSTGQGLLWDGLTSKWRPGNVPTGDPGPQGEIGFAGFKYDTRRVGANQYVIGEIIEYGGQYFICLANNDAIVPTGAAIGVYWSAYSFVGPPGSDGDHYHTTSTSTLTIAANGTISLTTVDLGLDYSVGQTVIIAHDINNHMHGDVVTYDPVTGVLTVLLKQKNGSGTYSSWSVNLSGPASSFPVIGSIDELNDVDTTTTAPTNGQALVWDATATQWKPGTVSGGGSLSSTVLSYTTSLLASGASTDLTVPGGNVFNLLAITSSSPVWVRVYGTTAARSADIRTQPGGIPPGSGNDYYAELVTVATPQTIRFSPVPVVQGTTGNAYVRIKNVDSSAQTITIDFTILTLEP